MAKGSSGKPKKTSVRLASSWCTGYRSKKFKYKLALWHTLISHFTVPGPAVCPPPQAAKKKSPISYAICILQLYFLEISKAGDPSIS